VYCSKCGKENKDEAEYCNKCGAKLSKSAKNKKEESQQEPKKETKSIEQVAKGFGEKAEQVGKRIEYRFNKRSEDFNQWFDQIFGIFGPLIWAFLALIILRIIIFGMDIIGDDSVVIGQIGDVLYEHILLIFGLMLVSTYNSYLLRKYKKQYRWISPAVSTAVFIVIIWIITKIFIVIDTELDIPVLTSIATFIESYLWIIFIAVILISYGFMIAVTPLEKK
jgi:hypothetical protein